MSKKKANSKVIWDKYHYYENSVQNVDFDIDFLSDEYFRHRKKKAYNLREDFCGTGALMCEWVKRDKKRKALGIDLDPEPMDWGKEKHFSKLSKDQKSRVTYLEQNVLDSSKIKSDIVVAFNFSYFIFKQRKQLVEYFTQVRKSLNKNGVFFIDLFGGPESQTVQEEETEHDDFSYFWDCDKFNPITNECTFYIHFKVGGKKYRKAFSYDWRLWGLPELRDILFEAGFTKTHAYWEGEDDDGGGDGEFYLSKEEENCESWVTYIAALAP